MLRKLPGIDIPAATEANSLHAAAFLEFKQHVERLAREGHDLAVWPSAPLRSGRRWAAGWGSYLKPGALGSREGIPSQTHGDPGQLGVQLEREHIDLCAGGLSPRAVPRLRSGGWSGRPSCG